MDDESVKIYTPENSAAARWAADNGHECIICERPEDMPHPEAHEKAVQLIVLFATMNFCHLTIGVGKTIFLSNSFRYNWVRRIGQHFCLA